MVPNQRYQILTERRRHTERQRHVSERVRFVGDAVDAVQVLRGTEGALRVPRRLAERWAKYLRGVWDCLEAEERCLRRGMLIDLAEAGDPDAIAAMRWLDDGELGEMR
jgi:hypothetical protein